MANRRPNVISALSGGGRRGERWLSPGNRHPVATHPRESRREVLAWVRSLPGSQRLRALVAFDEVYGLLPPHPANPPTKRPIVAPMKNA